MNIGQVSCSLEDPILKKTYFAGMNLKALFKRPHPFIFNRNSVLITGVATFFVLVVLSPFGYHTLPLKHRVWLALINSVIAASSIWLMVTFIQRFFPKWSKPENWVLGKEILLIWGTLLLIILLTYMFLLVSSITNETGISLFFQVFLKTMAISVIPISILVFFEQFMHQKKKLKQAVSISKQLKARKENYDNKENGVIQQKEKYILIPGENGKIELKLLPEELIYLKSEGNYIEVYYSSGTLSIQKKLIRNSLRSILEFLPASSFFHCQKSYIVNVDHIISVQGNARNLVLTVRNSDIDIPVSRAKTEALQNFLKTAG
ncbi:LytTR family DNA-binding domain-containing protein [Ascidiimonas aurantiaca]|uniref:LytR/AlgR family response regulator transcription factor n=1 Tax=Ascidiimonas aurantiaca TaxID=1685432 RepID=UPI0030EBCFF5